MVSEFTMVQGDTQYLIFECLDTNNQPINLANAKAMSFSVVVYNNNSNNKVIVKTSAQMVVEDVNKVTVKILPIDTLTLFGKFEYFFQIEDYSSDKFTKNGLFIIKATGI